MAINVDVRIQRLVPNENPEATVLVVLNEAEFKGTVDEEVVILKQLDDITVNFDMAEGKQELLEIAYLIQTGLIVIAVQDITTIDIEELAQDYDYRFIAMAGATIVDDTITEDSKLDKTLTLLDKVDAELFLQVGANFSGALNDGLEKPKISVFANRGLVAMNTKIGTADLKTEMEAPNGGIPVALAVLTRKARLILENKAFMPVAGYGEGRIGEFIKLKEQIGNVQRKALQIAGINPAVLKAGVGVVVVAQNTGEFLKEPANVLAKGHIVTQAIDFKRKLNNIAERTLHKLNNNKTWTLVQLETSTMFDRIKDAGGIENYTVRVGLNETMTLEDVRNGKLILRTAYTPVHAIEEIEATVIITENEEGFTIETDGGI